MLALPLAFLGALVAAPGVMAPAATNLTANVNDSRSHGLVGDQFLSLDEAIRLANGALTMAQLSMAEMGQLTGTGMMVDCIAIDHMMTPTITLEAPLTDVMPMMGPAMGMLTITGMSAMPMAMPMPVLDGSVHPRILTIRSHMVQVMGLELRNGQVGIDIRTMNGAMQPGQMAMVMDCMLMGQSTAGVMIHGAGTGESTAAMIMNTRFRNMPVGVRIDDQSVQGSVLTEDEFLAFDGVGIGYDITGNGRQNLSMNMMFRSTFRNGDRFVRLVRGAQSSQQHMIRIVHCDAMANAHCVDVQGANAGLTMVHHHHSKLAAPAGMALRAAPRTALFDLHGSENVFTGGVVLSGNLFTQRIWHQNNTYRQSIVVIDNDGAQPNLLWNVFDGGSVTVPVNARTPARFRGCEFRGVNVLGTSSFAPITLDGCFRTGGSTTGMVSQVAPAPSAFLGSATVTPESPMIGSSVALQAVMPYGVGAIWDLAVAEPRPATAVEPYRFYGDLGTVVVLPGLVVFQSRIDVPVPNNALLIGLEFYAQPVAVPLLSQPHVPPVQLPIGGLIRPRM